MGFSLGFLVSIKFCSLSQSWCCNALQEWSQGWIKSHATQAHNHIVDNGGTGHSSLQGYWRFWRGHTFPCHRRFPHCMRAFLTREARECLCILRHLCFGVCDTRGLKWCDGHWDLYRGTRWPTYPCASHYWHTKGSSHKGCYVVCLLQSVSYRLGDKGTTYNSMHLCFTFPTSLGLLFQSAWWHITGSFRRSRFSLSMHMCYLGSHMHCCTHMCAINSIFVQPTRYGCAYVHWGP